jgi:hypothetical protein
MAPHPARLLKPETTIINESSFRHEGRSGVG